MVELPVPRIYISNYPVIQTSHVVQQQTLSPSEIARMRNQPVILSVVTDSLNSTSF
jgi:hypothetical protein